MGLAAWLAANGITNLAMESTGVYWKPIWNLLEGQFELMLVNTQHIKTVPGRNTDMKDCEWIAELLQHGLLRGVLCRASISVNCAIWPLRTCRGIGHRAARMLTINRTHPTEHPRPR